MNATVRQPSATTAARAPAGQHPNEVDRKRIERAIENRKRYRYVSPSVHPIDNGYCVKSPCCSRNIDPHGGVVDVAIVQHAQGARPWRLYRKERSTNDWLLYAEYERLGDLLEQLNTDPQRSFWQ
jgi:hypothetical protein